MKCPLCGTWSTVLETRENSEGVTRRRRECANRHRFSSFEISETAYKRCLDKILVVLGAQNHRLLRKERNLCIAEDPRPLTSIAEEYGLSIGYIKSIKKEYRLGGPESGGEE